jgi:hypothetical protein
MGGQGKRLVERLKRSVQKPYVRRVSGQAGGVKGCLVGARPGAGWLDKRSGWLAAGSQLPKEHLSPLPLACALRGLDINFSDYLPRWGF